MTWRRKGTGALTHSWLRVSTSTFLEENLVAFIKTRLTKTSSHFDPTILLGKILSEDTRVKANPYL